MYFLDTSAVIELLSGTSKGQAIKDLLGEDILFLSSLVVHELLIGFSEKDQVLIEQFLQEVHVVPFDEGSTRKSSSLERNLRKKGLTPGKVDILLAGSCLFHGFHFISCDKSFQQIKELPLSLF